jgi:hypothetical protein
VVGSQIGNFTSSPSFGYNLCVKCPNGSCKPILDIYVSIDFQWYKILFNPLGFDPCDHSLNIQESIGTSTPKVGAQLGVWRFIPSHFLALPGAWNVTPGLHIWPAPLQALALVTSPRLGLWQILLSSKMSFHSCLLTRTNLAKNRCTIPLPNHHLFHPNQFPIEVSRSSLLTPIKGLQNFIFTIVVEFFYILILAL